MTAVVPAGGIGMKMTRSGRRFYFIDQRACAACLFLHKIRIRGPRIESVLHKPSRIRITPL
jgi:ribosomal protein L37E